MLQEEVEHRITPPLSITADTQMTQGVRIVRVGVPRGGDPPYAIDDSKIYVRSETETGLAVRDEIVNLVKRASCDTKVPHEETPTSHIEPPRTGVEVVETEERKGTRYHTLRDLRNGNVVKNVTRNSARKLWHYAIAQAEDHPVAANKVDWRGDIAMIEKRKHAGQARYDLVQRENGKLRVYYGVTEDGIHSEWTRLVGLDSESD
jgi:hypothetical protein